MSFASNNSQQFCFDASLYSLTERERKMLEKSSHPLMRFRFLLCRVTGLQELQLASNVTSQSFA